MQQRRRLSFREMETWLRELPWWRDWVQDVGGVPSTSAHGAGGGGGGRAGSPVEREALELALLRSRVDTLNRLLEALRRRQPEHHQLIELRYLTLTRAMGLPVHDCCLAMAISRKTFWRWRGEVIGQLIEGVYWTGIDCGRPYQFCRPELVPREALNS